MTSRWRIAAIALTLGVLGVAFSAHRRGEPAIARVRHAPSARSAVRVARPPAVAPGRGALTEPLPATAFFRRLADDACACADAACVDETNRYYTEHLGLLREDGDPGAAHDEERRATACIARLHGA